MKDNTLYLARFSFTRSSISRLCKSNDSDPQSPPSPPEGDARSQELLARIAQLQTQKVRLTDYQATTLHYEWAMWIRNRELKWARPELESWVTCKAKGPFGPTTNRCGCFISRPHLLPRVAFQNSDVQ
ncbi:hypothetical protein K1719_000740 [Acacia pycnantha]|nr:hypothetical protein K1719_000740 [Acacia pycnantha]